MKRGGADYTKTTLLLVPPNIWKFLRLYNWLLSKMIDTPEIKSTQFYQIIVKVHHQKQGVHHSTILTAQGP